VILLGCSGRSWWSLVIWLDWLCGRVASCPEPCVLCVRGCVTCVIVCLCVWCLFCIEALVPLCILLNTTNTQFSCVFEKKIPHLLLLSKHGKAFSQTKHSMHILMAYVFSREIWFHVLSLVGLHQCTPVASDGVFQEWWRNRRSPSRVSTH
jgi:hypothetical protein